MDLKAKSSLIRRYRAERLWSQEQLANVSGISLRTIQRLESAGNGSIETIKALASVFEVNADTLVWRGGSYKAYKHRQWGVVTFVGVLIGAAIVIGVNAWAQVIPPIALVSILGMFVVTAIVFSSMTIEVNEYEVYWFFGPGVFKKKLSLEEVSSCKKVRNPIWMGFGIHAFGTGWIFNVSGLLGIEVELTGGSFIRLGTNQPNHLVQAIVDAKDNMS